MIASGGPLHHVLRTGVSAEMLDAAKRLRERGSFSVEKFRLAVKAACIAAKVPEFTPGRFRRSVATWVINQGADPAVVAAFLGHKSPCTTRRFYATHAAPTKYPRCGSSLAATGMTMNAPPQSAAAVSLGARRKTQRGSTRRLTKKKSGGMKSRYSPGTKSARVAMTSSPLVVVSRKARESISLSEPMPSQP
ncbi:hypothetical protein D7X55_02945 [Corallococcus sp. AB049A]|nr:hypothetical protein D7X55_02945 [Corallococcus sp. AB049A]